MGAGFTKLFESILDSSIWLEDDHTRLVWVALMAMADQHGEVFASLGGLAHRARVPRDACAAAVDKFLAPDPDSRTPEHEGRRIEVIAGGWRLLNHATYRKKASADDRREQEAERKRRARAQASAPVRTRPHAGAMSAQAEAEAEAEAKAVSDQAASRPATPHHPEPLVLTGDPGAIVDPLSGRKARRAAQLPPDWNPGEDARAAFREAGWRDVDIDRELAGFRDHAAANGRTAKDWAAAFRMWMRKAEEYRCRRPTQRAVGRAEPETGLGVGRFNPLTMKVEPS